MVKSTIVTGKALLTSTSLGRARNLQLLESAWFFFGRALSTTLPHSKLEVMGEALPTMGAPQQDMGECR